MHHFYTQQNPLRRGQDILFVILIIFGEKEGCLIDDLCRNHDYNQTSECHINISNSEVDFFFYCSISLYSKEIFLIILDVHR